jgi:UDP-N-acetylmuramate--alanine ligase
LARQIARKNKFPVDYIARREDLVLYLEKIAKNRDLIITLGAGDVYKIGEMFIANWKKKAREMA